MATNREREKDREEEEENERERVRVARAACGNEQGERSVANDQVGDLWHLTYLGLRGTRIKCLPSSLQNLHNLETLDVRDTLIKFLPSSITNIKKLRHLLLRNMKIHGSDVLVMMPSGIDNLRHLQTLSGLKADIYSLELAHLTQLKKLYVSITGQEEARTLFAAINQIANLHSLKIGCRDRHGKYTELMLETLLPLPQYLEKLTLGANIMELPLWFAHFKSLRVLVLVNSMLVFDPLSNLSGLPNLVSLSLFHAYTGEQMGCRQGGFPKLRHLHITSFIELGEWTPIEEGTMPCTQFIRIVDCGKLSMLPQGFEQLRTLESLELIEMSQEFIRKLVEEDFYKVHHISKVIALPRISCERNLLDSENLQLKIHESSGASSSSSPFVEATRKRKLGNQTG
ncbi:putative disease resistance RPP8-like protein 2 [Cinnamomum micranthum f. kanehirae]|uniref:Putative disease resistance RPP8-like protein 2 n=1 Tax=Cinnamomum micranthum f. kanehirae TaxID=337451 RepID=A0A443P209_9MAGN|nr:putative disease resistance RPP8-like protein 2 [Cinnamomum micranthum f. kanehirae]